MPSRRAITATASMVTVARIPTIRPTMNARLSIVQHLRPYWSGCIAQRSASATARGALPEPLGKCDHNALRAADVTEPVHVLVLSDFADELCAMGAQAREYVLDVVDGEHDATYAQRVHWCVLRLSSDRCGRVELVQLDPTVAVRSPHHCDLASNVVQPDDKVNPTA